jgi:ribosomal protein S18 acetylase RimI-like enzyme
LSKHRPNQTNVYKTRLATTDDAETLAEIGLNTFHDTFAGYNTPENMKLYLEKTFTIDRIKQDLMDERCICILAYDGPRAVGYAKLRKPHNGANNSKLEIERIYAIKEYIGMKVGKTLMQTCISIAGNLGYKSVWLGVWEYNASAIAFYKKWGFETIGSHRFLLGEDLQTDLLMEKKLAAE